MLSYWEHETLTTFDALVIGGGIVGITTAMEYKKRRPADSVAVLERGLLPSGASTKNAGFTCFGSLTEILADLRRYGENQTLTVIEQRWRGLQELRKRFAPEMIGYTQCGGSELIFQQRLCALEKVDEVNGLLRTIIGADVFVLHNNAIRSFGFDAATVKALIYNQYEGALHTGKLMKSMWDAARECGVEIMTGANAIALEECNSGVQVYMRQFPNTPEVALKASRVAICTNGLIADLAPHIAIRPGRSHVLITEPISDLRIQGAFHFDEGFYYFRNVGNRILFGGGRNIALEAEETAEFGSNQKIYKNLEHYLRNIILPGHDVDIDRYWCGIMGFSEAHTPIVEHCSENIVVGFGCNGMGVALGSLVGKQTADLLAA